MAATAAAVALRSGMAAGLSAGSRSLHCGRRHTACRAAVPATTQRPTTRAGSCCTYERERSHHASGT